MITISDEVLTQAQAASYLKYSRTALWDMRKKGLLSAYKIGRKVLYKKADLDLLVASSIEGKEVAQGK